MHISNDILEGLGVKPVSEATLEHAVRHEDAAIQLQGVSLTKLQEMDIEVSKEIESAKEALWEVAEIGLNVKVRTSPHDKQRCGLRPHHPLPGFEQVYDHVMDCWRRRVARSNMLLKQRAVIRKALECAA